MKVQLIAKTAFQPPIDVPWEPDAPARYGYGMHDGGQLVEFAGRACYQSWSKPNPDTATNAGYLQNILNVGHFSVLEHATATFYLEGVSRSFTHEFVRHRHLSPSQLSQRFVDESGVAFVTPPLVERSEAAQEIFDWVTAQSLDAYERLVETLTEEFPDATRKQVREAARSVLPNATETKIVMTGNFRAWRHFIDLRAHTAADAEIRKVAVEVLRQLQDLAPAVFGDYVISGLIDGSEIAESQLREAS